MTLMKVELDHLELVSLQRRQGPRGATLDSALIVMWLTAWRTMNR